MVAGAGIWTIHCQTLILEVVAPVKQCKEDDVAITTRKSSPLESTVNVIIVKAVLEKLAHEILNLEGYRQIAVNSKTD